MRHELPKGLIALLACSLLLGCNRTDQAQLATARKEADAARAGTEAAKAELAKVRKEADAAKAAADAAKAELAKARKEADAAKPNPEGTTRAQSLEVTDSEGKVFRIKDAVFRTTGSTYVISGTQYFAERNAIPVKIGGAELKIPLQDVYAVVKHKMTWVVLKSGEVNQCDQLTCDTLLGETEAGLKIAFNTYSIRKIINPDTPPTAAASRSVADLEATIAKSQKNFRNGGIAKFPDGKEKRFKTINYVYFIMADGASKMFDLDTIYRIAFDASPGKTARVTTTEGAQQTFELAGVERFSVTWTDGSIQHFNQGFHGLTFTAESAAEQTR